MVHVRCVFVASIHPSRTWMSGSFQSMWWNACVHRLDLGLYSCPKESWGNGVRTHVNSRGKIPSTGKNSPQRRIEPMALYQAGEHKREIPSTRKILPKGGSNPRRCIKHGSEPNTLPISYFGPTNRWRRARWWQVPNLPCPCCILQSVHSDFVHLTHNILYHTIPHQLCRFELWGVHSLKCFG